MENCFGVCVEQVIKICADGRLKYQEYVVQPEATDPKQTDAVKATAAAADQTVIDLENAWTNFNKEKGNDLKKLVAGA